ncbi:phosphoribosylaminoimidazole synthetase [Paenibacillus sp. SC116]|uniref:phosphoribosylaminoimidazole synthetase n=1 Tax=Paenibacillus sp. SC116 TaxID=2968986 RepID=UPI00215AA3C5|nr:phosphoribosylaminoimidazole synthetase [Paenibacillus sp. SC116]MCR8843765.1 phosphoribosylaminoimidazole synthetase [Paenibacillus sp. SC116]
MKVRCIANTGDKLSRKTRELGNTTETKYSVKIDEIYTVYGKHLYKGVLSYLLLGTYENLPSWYPAELFEVTNSLLPLEWYYQFFGHENSVSAVWGYKELVAIESHHDDLIEREDEAVRIFLKRKKEIDEFSE